MTPDDKKRIEEIRSTIAARTMQAFAEGRDDRRQLELDAHFLLAQLDEAHVALRKIAKDYAHDMHPGLPGAIARKALGEG